MLCASSIPYPVGTELPGGLRVLTETVPGGWVRYKASRAEGDNAFTMELVAHGTGARSELGVP